MSEHGRETPIGRWQWLLENMDVCKDVDDRAELFRKILAGVGGGPRILSFVNAHAANLIWEDSAFSESIFESTVIVRDGVGMKLLMKLCGAEPGRNLNGTDLIPLLLSGIDRFRRIAVYGTNEPWLGKGADAVRGMGFSAVTAANGFYSDRWYVERVRVDEPDVVLLCMGMPKQERIASLLRESLEGRDVLIINGGAVIDFLAGRFPRAPGWMRKVGMEWVYRLGREPRRLWRRYLLGNMRFVVRSIKVCFALR